MDVILLENNRKLGVLGDQVKVKAGYARNYLVPQGKALYATKENRAKVASERAELEKIAKERHTKAVARQQLINALPPVKITAKAGEEGKLFGSINVRDIVDALNQLGAEVEKREISLPEGTLRMLGDYDIHIELGSDVSAVVKVSIVS